MVALSPLQKSICQIVAEIPEGTVTTYGSIAHAIGMPRGARQVGWAMAAMPDDSETDLPWHRVVGFDGTLTAGWRFGHPEIMKQRLLNDGVPFRAEYQVDIKRCLWLPAAYEMDDLQNVTV